MQLLELSLWNGGCYFVTIWMLPSLQLILSPTSSTFISTLLIQSLLTVCLVNMLTLAFGMACFPLLCSVPVSPWNLCVNYASPVSSPLLPLQMCRQCLTSSSVLLFLLLPQIPRSCSSLEIVFSFLQPFVVLFHLICSSLFLIWPLFPYLGCLRDN